MSTVPIALPTALPIALPIALPTATDREISTWPWVTCMSRRCPTKQPCMLILRSGAFLYTLKCFPIYAQVLFYIRSSAFLYTFRCFSIYVQVLFYISSSVFLYIFNDFHIILSVLFAVVACRGEGTLAYLLTGIPHDECVGCCGVGRLMLFAHRECSCRRVDEIVGHLFV